MSTSREKPPLTWPQRLRRWSLQGLALLLLLWAMEYVLTFNMIHGQAPNFAVTLLSGEQTPLHRPGSSPKLLHFWAEWCGICALEHGSIQAIAADHEVITIAMQSGSPAEVRDFMQSEDINYPTVADPNGRIAEHYGVSAVPASFILDADNNIRFVTRGYTSETGLRLRLWLASWW